MSIASEITRLQGVKANILQAISDKGVTVPAGSALDDCPTLIASITGGGGDVSISTQMIDSEVGIKVVDENGYVGATLTNYFPHVGNTYYNNYAIVVEGADFSQSGLGRVTFITPGSADIGGRTYRTVNIGGVEWLAENLDYKFSGCNIGGSGTPSTPNAWYYNNDEATYGIDGTYKCGLLYNWYAVKLLNDNRNELIPGWHVPTISEWNTLMTTVGGESTAGTVLKAKNNSIMPGFPTNWDGDDDYGFGIIPTGDYNGEFRTLGTDTAFWTISGNNSYAYYVGCGRYPSLVYGNTGPKINGISLRLVRDSN